MVEMSCRITQLPARLTTVPCSIPVVSRGPAAASRLHSQGCCGARLDNRAPASMLPERSPTPIQPVLTYFVPPYSSRRSEETLVLKQFLITKLSPG